MIEVRNIYLSSFLPSCVRQKTFSTDDGYNNAAETQKVPHAGIFSGSMSMLRKIESGWLRRQWEESLRNSGLTKLVFIFVPGYAQV
jgi:hypothetical protein